MSLHTRIATLRRPSQSESAAGSLSPLLVGSGPILVRTEPVRPPAPAPGPSALRDSGTRPAPGSPEETRINSAAKPGHGSRGRRGGSCLPTSVGKTATRSPKEKFRAISESDRWIFLPPPPPPGIPAFTAASLCAAVNAKSESAERRATELRRRESKRAQKEEKGKKSVAAAGC